MKQLTYTSCQTGRSINGQSGFQVRAATPGLPPDRLSAALRYVAYRLPPGLPPETSSAAAPLRLALLDSPDLGQLLAHTSHAGQDPSTDRSGNYFTHLVLDLPPEVTPLTALHSWGSPFWQQTDGEGPTELSDVSPSALGEGTLLGDASLTEFVHRPGGRDLVRFLLTAFLASGAGASQRIFLAAPAGEVALALYGLVRTLPGSLTRGLTFSTYESDPLGSPARVVGTCWAAGADADLPSSCYESGLACNSYSGRQSPLPAAPAIVEVILQQVGAGQLGPLETFGRAWDRLGLPPTHEFDLVYRLTSGEEPSPDDVRTALAQPALAGLLADQPGLARKLLDQAVADPDFRKDDFPRFAEALKARPALQRQFAEEAHQAGLHALTRAPDLGKAKVWLEEVLPLLAPGRGNRVWEELFSAIEVPEQMPSDVRLYLLPLVLPRDVTLAESVSKHAARWLSVGPEQVEEVLAMPLSPAYKLLAAQVCLSHHREPPAPVVRALSTRPDLLLDVLPRVGDEWLARELFAQAVALMKGTKLADDLLKRSSQLSPGLLDHGLEVLFRKGEGGPDWARKHGRALVKTLPAGRSVAVLARQVMEGEGDPPPELMDFLKQVEQSEAARNLEANELQRLRDLLGVDAFLRKPTLDEEKLVFLAGILAQMPRTQPGADALRERVAAKALELLYKLPFDPQVALERVLAILGPVVGVSPRALYARMIGEYRQKKDLPERPMLIHALVAVGFGDTHRTELADQLDPAETSALVGHVTRGKKGAEILKYIEKRSENWPKTARERWTGATTVVQEGAREPGPETRRRKLLGGWVDWKDILLFALVLLVAVLLAMLVQALRTTPPSPAPGKATSPLPLADDKVTR